MIGSSQQWPPDYVAESQRRQGKFRLISGDKKAVVAAKLHLSTNPVDFIQDWCLTYDPRNATTELPLWMPFILFPKQVELVDWLQALIEDQECGLIEKSRDMGATWVCAAFSVWLWLFSEGSIGWGSRKEQLVDRMGDTDSIFEKIRRIIDGLPDFLLPQGLDRVKHLNYMKCLNPETGATITGEAGDNIGRGGRKLIYFKDESAHYERAELIEAALGDNTNVQVDISSVNGDGNMFHRRRHSGAVRVLEMDWRDHPAKDQVWYDNRRKKAEAEGLLHVFAQEVDRDYSAAVEDILIPAEYVKACIDAHIVLDFEGIGKKVSGLDVADEGGDKNAQIDVYGPLITGIDQWGEGDTVKTAKRAWNHCITEMLNEMVYDSIGVGAGVKGKTNELRETSEASGQSVALEVIGFNAGLPAVDPEEFYVDGKKNKDMFANSKAQAWWALRDRCFKTYQAVVKGEEYCEADLLSIPSNLEYSSTLVSELSRVKRETDESGRIRVESKKKLKKRGIKSPNLADALVMCYAPRATPRIVRVMVI